jgi:hypothetical protein
MAQSKWERYMAIGGILGVIAFLITLLGEQFTPLAYFLGIISFIFIVVSILIMAKFLKKTPF